MVKKNQKSKSEKTETESSSDVINTAKVIAKKSRKAEVRKDKINVRCRLHSKLEFTS